MFLKLSSLTFTLTCSGPGGFFTSNSVTVLPWSVFVSVVCEPPLSPPPPLPLVAGLGLVSSPGEGLGLITGENGSRPASTGIDNVGGGARDGVSGGAVPVGGGRVDVPV